MHKNVIRVQCCVFTKDVNNAILISDAMETATVQINSVPARGPDHFPFQVVNPLIPQILLDKLHISLLSYGLEHVIQSTEICSIYT